MKKELLIKGLKLLSVLMRDDADRERFNFSGEHAHDWNEADCLEKGALVRSGNNLGIVVRAKTVEHYGIVALLDVTKCKWYFLLHFCPYLNEVGYDGSCGLITEACSKDDGLKNYEMVECLKKRLDEENQKRSMAMPPADRHVFPAFDVCRITMQDAYLPAVNELKLLVLDKELFDRFVELKKNFDGVDMANAEGTRVLWSSTDAQKSYPGECDISYSDAFAVEVDKDGKIAVLSVKKKDEAWAVPYCRF